MTAADPLAARRNQIPRGILYMVASTVMFAGVNAIVKWEVALYPVGEVAFFRSLFALIPCYLIVLPRHGLQVWRTERPFDHVKRAVSQLFSMTAIFIAFKLMPLAGAVAISFSAPLFTTLLSILLALPFCTALPLPGRPGSAHAGCPTASAVGQARVVARPAAAQHGLPVREATPNAVKTAVAGYGAAGPWASRGTPQR